MDFHLNGGSSPTNKGISAHTGMPFLIEREPQGYFLHLPKIFYGLKIYEMKTEKIIRLRVSLSLEFKAPKLVKVRRTSAFAMARSKRSVLITASLWDDR